MVSHQELARDFVHGDIAGKASNMYIDGDTIYSYGSHFPIAKRLGSFGYLFNPMKHSSSTSRHQSTVYRALRGEIWEAPDCNPAQIPIWLLGRALVCQENILKARYSRTLEASLRELEDIQQYWNLSKRRFGLKSEELEIELLFNDKEKIASKLVAHKLSGG